MRCARAGGATYGVPSCSAAGVLPMLSVAARLRKHAMIPPDAVGLVILVVMLALIYRQALQ